MPRSRRRWHAPPPPKEIYDAPFEADEMPVWGEFFDPDERNRTLVRIWLYRGLIVNFVLCQQTLRRGRWIEIARIDCCHGEVHRHDVDEHGRRLAKRILIREIPPGEAGWKVVEEEYETARLNMERSWEDRLRRWRG
jgi:hypothetical protein